MSGQGPNPGTMVRALAWDVGLPLLTYYALHLLGYSDWVALFSATCAAGMLIVWTAARDRTVNMFAAVMLAVFGIGLVLTLVSGDERYLLLKASITTAIVGSAFLVAAMVGRPLTLAAAERWQPGYAAEMAERYRTDPLVRRGHGVCSVVWGVGLLTEASIRVPLIFLLPVSVMVGLSTAMMIATIGGLIVWSGRYAARLRRTAASTGTPATSDLH